MSGEVGPPIIWATLAIGLCSVAALAQPAGPDPLLRWMDQIAQNELAQRESAIAAVRTKPDAERRRKRVRAKLLEIIGGLPDYHGPLNARITGRLTNSSYISGKGHL